MRPWPSGLALLLALCAVAQAPGLAHASGSRATRAERLLASARRRVADGTHEQRRCAISELEEAALLDPARSEIPLALGRLYLEADLLHNARILARNLTAKDSTSAGAWRLQGEVWRRYWLTEADQVDRDRAIRCVAHSARLAPSEPAGWKLLVPMLVHADEPEIALEAATYGVRAAPHDPETQLLLAATSQRVGDLPAATHWFERGLARLSPAERERYDDVTPLLPSFLAQRVAAMDSARRDHFATEFWTGADPDPITPENEARLEYWARVTEARALYGESHDGLWDIRAQYYVRFGPPALEECNPIMLAGGFNAPGDVLSWIYPDLGLRVVMSASTALSGYPAPLSSPGLWAHADPESLARHRELVPVYAGYAVFHRLPGERAPLDARLAVARFRTESGTSLLAQVEAAGGIEDQWNVDWVVLDSTSTPLARDQREMSASACEAERAKASSFAVTLTPGRYRVGVQISDSMGVRAVLARDVYVSPAVGRLALSDLVVTCGPPATSVVPGSGVRLEPVTGLLPVDGDRLNAYVEIYGLARASESATFSYECLVRPQVEDDRGWISRWLSPRQRPPTIRMSRSETTIGPLRRQFMSVPVGSLPAGRYDIEVLVRDAGNGEEVRSVAQFERGQ